MVFVPVPRWFFPNAPAFVRRAAFAVLVGGVLLFLVLLLSGNLESFLWQFG